MGHFYSHYVSISVLQYSISVSSYINEVQETESADISFQVCYHGGQSHYIQFCTYFYHLKYSPQSINTTLSKLISLCLSNEEKFEIFVHK